MSTKKRRRKKNLGYFQQNWSAGISQFLNCVVNLDVISLLYLVVIWWSNFPIFRLDPNMRTIFCCQLQQFLDTIFPGKKAFSLFKGISPFSQKKSVGRHSGIPNQCRLTENNLVTLELVAWTIGQKPAWICRATKCKTQRMVFSKFVIFSCFTNSDNSDSMINGGTVCQ